MCSCSLIQRFHYGKKQKTTQFFLGFSVSDLTKKPIYVLSMLLIMIFYVSLLNSVGYFFSVAQLFFSFLLLNFEMLKSDNIIFFLFVISLLLLLLLLWKHQIQIGLMPICLFVMVSIVQLMFNALSSSLYFVYARIEIIIDYVQCCLLPMTTQIWIQFFSFYLS